MPQNKRESLIYTIMMCFIMVLWMSLYNVFLRTGEISSTLIRDAWLGFPLAYIVALCCDLFFVSKAVKSIAFKFLLKPTSSTIQKIITISGLMVVFMVIIMSLYGAIIACLNTNEWDKLIFIWLIGICQNFIMALPFQILIAGNIVRFVFRKAFPVGSIS